MNEHYNQPHTSWMIFRFKRHPFGWLVLLCHVTFKINLFFNQMLIENKYFSKSHYKLCISQLNLK